VVHAADFPEAYADALGGTVGSDFFEFTPNPNDAVTGVPEGGTYTAATSFEPGKMYFVRCLTAEGASLVFDATATRAKRATVSPDWRVKVTATGTKLTSTVYAGMSRTATRGFDRDQDSALPPSVGGFQLAITDGGAPFRDTRPNSGGETYTMQLTGLTAGKTYTLNFTQDVGFQRYLAVLDVSRNVRTPIYRQTSYSFKASSTAMNFQLIVGAGR
jgi:hypothetical protein